LVQEQKSETPRGPVLVMEYLLAQEHMTPAINLFMEELRLDLAKEVILEELKLQVLERMTL